MATPRLPPELAAELEDLAHAISQPDPRLAHAISQPDQLLHDIKELTAEKLEDLAK